MAYPNDPRGAQQPGYQQWQGYPPPRPTNGMAIAALVCAFLFPLLGIIFGHVAHSQIKRTGEEGGGMATAALVISYLFTLAGLAFVFFVLVGLVVIGENVDNQKPIPTVTDTGSAQGTSYRVPRQSSLPGSDRAVVIQISDKRSISF